MSFYNLVAPGMPKPLQLNCIEQPALCDISSNFIGTNVTIPAAFLCINRRLYHIAIVGAIANNANLQSDFEPLFPTYLYSWNSRRLRFPHRMLPALLQRSRQRIVWVSWVGVDALEQILEFTQWLCAGLPSTASQTQGKFFAPLYSEMCGYRWRYQVQNSSTGKDSSAHRHLRSFLNLPKLSSQH